MPALEDLLRQFELALLPHERYFVAQGLVAPFWRDLPELAAGYGVSSYLDAQAQRWREDAHQAAAGALQAFRSARAEPPPVEKHFGVLLAWAVVEVRLRVVGRFSAFALLLNTLGGRSCLPLAASLYAAAALHPAVSRADLLGPEALAEMSALQRALQGTLTHSSS